MRAQSTRVSLRRIKDEILTYNGDLKKVAKKVGLPLVKIRLAVKEHAHVARTLKNARGRSNPNKPSGKQGPRKKRIVRRRPSIDLSNVITTGQPINITRSMRDIVFNLAKIFCTFEEIASTVGMSISSVKRHCHEEYTQGRMVGRQSLRRYQWRNVKDGSDAMQRWLGVQELRQSKEPRQDEQRTIDEYDFSKLDDVEMTELVRLLTKSAIHEEGDTDAKEEKVAQA